MDTPLHLLLHPHCVLKHFSLCCVSYRNQSFVLQSKKSDWFLYETQLWAEMGVKAHSCKEYFENGIQVT